MQPVELCRSMSRGSPVARLAGVEVGGTAAVRLMAVINVSPESFYSGSVAADAAKLRERARRCADEGADFIDIGAMSTAPYLETEVSGAEEERRMVAAVATVVGAVALPVSADTSRANVAEAALAAGAAIINDVGGLRSPGMAEIAARAAGVVVMASPGMSSAAPRAASPLDLVVRDLREALARARSAGVAGERIVVDPGIGFYTNTPWSPLEFNAAILRTLPSLHDFGHPLLIGVSRKAFIGELTGRADVEQRLSGSLAATAIAVWNGAAVVRTHDVAATRDAVRVAQGLM
jgi:dihydropteroate synthase